MAGYVLSKDRIVRDYPVEIPRLLDGGGVELRKVSVAFKLLKRSAIEGYRSDVELLRAVLLDFGPIETEAGETVAFGPEIRDLLLDDDAARIALATAYLLAVNGGARRKN